jgi:hypothetical protein
LDWLVAEGPRSLALILAMLAAETVVLAGAVYVIAIRLRGARWHALGLRPMARRWYAGAGLFAVLCFPLVGAINFGVQFATGEAFRNPQHEIFTHIEFSWPALFATLAMTGVVVPFAEELAFRGLVYGWLRERWGVWPGAALSALAFSALHGIPLLIPAIAALGVVLAVVYERSGSLLAPWIVHGVFNATATIVLFAAGAAGIPL